MARMSIDDMFLRDTRVKSLAMRMGWSKYETRGRLLEVYALVYDRVDAGGDGILTAKDIDLAAEFEGLAEAMISENLAAQTRNGIRIRGADERTKYLASRESSGRSGGIKSGESRRNKAKQETKVTFANSEGPLNPSASAPDLPSASPSAPNPNLQDPPIAPQGALDSFRAKVDEAVKKRRASDPTASELETARVVLAKLSQRSGVKYRGSDAHTSLIVARLRDGLSEQDLRAVIGYCALEKGWETDPSMQQYLRPETLFGPRTIEKYLDAARTWFEKLVDDEPRERQEHWHPAGQVLA